MKEKNWRDDYGGDVTWVDDLGLVARRVVLLDGFQKWVWYMCWRVGFKVGEKTWRSYNSLQKVEADHYGENFVGIAKQKIGE